MTEQQNNQLTISQRLQMAETSRLIALSKNTKNQKMAIDRANELFTEAITLLNNSGNLAAKEKKQLAWAYAHRGATQLQQGLIERRDNTEEARDPFDGAIGDFMKSTELKPRYPWAWAHLGEAHHWLALVMLDRPDDLKSNLEKAEEAFTQAIEQNQKYAWAFAHRGANRRFMVGLKDNYAQEALDDLNKAIELMRSSDTNPDSVSLYVWAYAYRSSIYRILKQFDKALDDIFEAVAFDIDVLASYEQLGGFFQMSAATPNKTSRLRPHALSVLPPKAEWAKQELANNPENPNLFALYVLALDKAETEGLEAAKEEIEKARAAGVA